MNSTLTLLDSCIIDYAAKDATRISCADLLSQLNKTHSLGISLFTRFEAYRGTNNVTAGLIKSVFEHLGTAPVNKKCIDTAAALYTCYEKSESIKPRLKSISDGDILIGASGFVFNTVIITSNRDDFPSPFFTEKNHYEIIKTSKKKNTSTIIHITELSPNYKYFNQEIKNCYPTTK
ncbi:hypothetical protein KDA00_01795 [Candidatus Saccharibacteria bacterium]|nr:hypothetical protein [Candidatus Saccharibacteria bacterium]